MLTEDDDTKKASFFFTAYTKDGVEDPATRPIVFAFNGGPGSSSVWLHLGLLGPMRVELDEKGNNTTTPGKLVVNEHTLLTHADLVFIDPISTGFTRAIDKDDERSYHHFEKDIETVGDFIRRYLTRYERWASPKFLAGESYGTTRSAGLAGHLQNRYGLFLNGLILISSVLNFQTIALDAKTHTFHRGNDLPYVVYLPSYTATAWYHGALDEDLQDRDLDDLLSEVEGFAGSDYLVALQQGSRIDEATFDEIAERLARYTGLPEAFVRRSDLRIEKFRFMKELLRTRASRSDGSTPDIGVWTVTTSDRCSSTTRPSTCGWGRTRRCSTTTCGASLATRATSSTRSSTQRCGPGTTRIFRTPTPTSPRR